MPEGVLEEQEVLTTDEAALRRRFKEEMDQLADTTIVLRLDAHESWALLGQLRYALEHPGNDSPDKEVASSVATYLVGHLCPEGSARREMYERGGNR